jgi:putative flippase GtrA
MAKAMESAACPAHTGPSTQLIRFSVVGILNTILYVATLTFAIEIFDLRQSISNTLAYLIASSFSFFINSTWSFRVRPQLRRYGRFQLVGLLSLMVCAIVGHMGDVFCWHYMVTVLVTGLVVPFISFLAHRHYTFSKTFPHEYR